MLGLELPKLFNKFNKNVESGYPCLVSNLRVNAFSFSLLRMACCGLVIYGLYYIEIGSLYAHFVEFLYILLISIGYFQKLSVAIEIIIQFLAFNF